jgi:acyl dehydratase
MKYKDISIGQAAELAFKVTPAMVDHFIIMTGDFNRVHYGPRSIVHGMLTSAFLSTFIGMQLPGDGSVIVSITIKFIQPVKANDELLIKGTVIDKSLSNKQVTLHADVYREGELIIASSCIVKVPE